MLERISFVCQAGELEPKAILLAASLRRRFPADLKLLAAHPQRHGALRPATVAALRDLNVETVAIENPLHEKYLIGHKVAALGLLAGAGVGMFLDSDIIAVRAPEELPAGLAAVPTGARHCPLPVWRHIYRKFGLGFPSDGSPPYFNSGAIAVPGDIAAQFAATWTHCAKEIDKDPAVPAKPKRPFLDQTSFPIAAAALGLPITALGPQWNFPSWVWRIPDGFCPIFFHYQNIPRLTREDQTLEAAHAALSVSPLVTQALSSQRAIGGGTTERLAGAITRHSFWAGKIAHLAERLF